MEQILGWARVWFAAKREDEGESPLRNGAWYPVLSSGVNRAVLEVSGQRVAVPQDMLEVRDKRPDRFTVVYRTYDDPNPARGTRADAGRRYGVCPKCSAAASSRRAPPVTTASTKESWRGGKPVEAEGMTRLGIEPRTYGLKVIGWLDTACDAQDY